MEYGTGAIMAVPGHDERDFEFARAVRAADRARWSTARPATLVDVGAVRGGAGLASPEAKARRSSSGSGERGRGRPAVNYRLRDWGFSRQRYWGCPIPIVYCERLRDRPRAGERASGPAAPPRGLPPEGQAAARAGRGLVNVPCPKCGKPAQRETETMDTFLDSAWYFLRYCDPHNDRAPFERELVDYWSPVDLYIGGDRPRDDAPDLLALLRQGAERHGHARLPRAVPRPSTTAGCTVGDEDVEVAGQRRSRPTTTSSSTAPIPCASTSSSSGPPTRTWSGPRKVSRRWRASCAGCGGSSTTSPDAPRAADGDAGALTRKAHATIAKVTDDVGRRFAFNTAISAVMELVNELARDPHGAERALRSRDGRVAAPAVRAACDRRAVAAAGPRTALGGAVAGRRRVAARARDLRARRAGERQGAGPGRGARRRVGGRARRRRARVASACRRFIDGAEVRQTIVVPQKLVNIVLGSSGTNCTHTRREAVTHA